MAYRLIILKVAAEDTLDAYKYYEEQQPGLGDRFLGEILGRYNELSNHPQYYGYIDDKLIVRDVGLKSFPYVVVYEIKEDTVIIYSIHNTHRHPDNRFKK